jgi:hypothetical protein
MSQLRLDDCDHCAAVTPLHGYTKEQAIEALENKELGCWLCAEEGDTEHSTCVVLYEDGVPVWDGRCSEKRIKE